MKTWRWCRVQWISLLKMDRRTIAICLALSMLTASSNSTINPSSTTLTSTITQSNTIVSSNINPSGSVITPSSSPSSLTVNPSSTTASQFGFLSPKPSSSYEVTENVIDIPDDRILPPIVSNFNLFKPINVANTSINVNKITKNDTGDENNQPKRTSFTYVHFTKDTEHTKEGGITKLFRGIKDYVYNLKKGVVDGLHNYFHRDDKKKNKEESFYDKFHKNDQDFDKDNSEIEFHHKFHRSFHSDENYDDYEYDHDEFQHDVKDLKD